jgi:tetratricopeptide (TPR) repeat protein
MTDEPTDPVPDETATKREGHSPERRRPARPETLARGAALGRYLVLDKIGEGGMGVVYAAFDPELDRKVAIKVLQTAEAGESSGGQAWLLREAQALARLQHPNVVAVHDVGTLAEDQIFVAMELVDGVTMRAWLKDQPRMWREVVPVMRAAGAGLAAAHQAGLVHRDFKPENVLVGKDGRVRVMDFGLARLHALDESEPHVETKSPLTAELTLAGHVVGTPAYMAPELYRGQPADARSDQFSFGVTLFEALFRVRPYDRKELQGKTAGKPKIPSDTRVPAALQKVALQALALAPEQRFASMDELLGELARDPLARRRNALLAGAGVLALGGAIGATMLVAGHHAQRCEGLEHRLDGTWDAAIKQRVREAYNATKLPFAGQAYADLERAIDVYTSEWVATARESCEATRVRGDQTEEVLSLRQECLDQRLDGVGALARIATEPTKVLVEKGGAGVRDLQPIATCGNVAALRAQVGPPPEAEAAVRELNKKLADAEANIIAGNYVAAGAAALAASRKADEIHFMPLKAQAELMRGLTLAAVQSFDEARKVLSDATLLALTGRRDDIAAHGALTLAMIDAQNGGKPDAAKVWFAVAKAENKRYGSDASMTLHEYEIEGVIAGMTGDSAGAVAAHEKAFTGVRGIYGDENPMIWEDESIYATSISRMLDFGGAAHHYEHALKLRESVVGPDHPDVALELSNLGACYTRLRDPRGKATLERALAIREKAFGKGHPAVVPTLQNLAENLRTFGDAQAAQPVGERSVRISRALPGVEHPLFHNAATDYVQTLAALGRFADAHALLDEVLPIEKRTGSAIRPDTEGAAAVLALAEHAWADAAAHAKEADAGYEAAGGKDDPNRWWALSMLGRAQLELGKPDEARASVETAIAIGERAHLHEADLADARATLARLPPR